MPGQSEKPLIGKFHIGFFVLIVLGAGFNLLFNPEARKLVGLSRNGGLSVIVKKLFQGHTSVVVRAAAKTAQPSFSAEELTAFTQSFTQREVKDIFVPPPPPPPVDPKEELAKKESEQKAAQKRAEEEARQKLAYLWPVCVQGAYRDLQSRWTAIVAGHNVRVGDCLASGRNDLCRYALLSVGQRCVWMRVSPPGESAVVALPDIEWPDVELIELKDAGVVKRDYKPDCVRLGSGEKLKVRDALEYRGTGARFIVKQLWMSGVVFEAVKGDAHVEIACSLVMQ